ncbi:aromatic ring-hydroxylating dioxygenase subunit alpha [Roseovarius aestuarii]|nr:aromatic ring-hydroxylating dioxygenase subunit alpha [Roseovarius aestuarii]
MLDNTPELAALLDRHTEGLAFPREFYTSRGLYDAEIRQYWNASWIWVGHICQIPEPGDFFTFDYGPESIIIARDRAGEVGAFLNVCRHRGSRVCTEAAGNARLFVCPYHAWTYELNGRLRGAQHMPEGFDPSAHGLLRAHIRVFQGMILICTADSPPDIDPVLKQIAPLTAPFGLDRLRIAHEASYPVPANWKLALENYMECYHCGPAHQEYSRSHSLKDPASMTPELMGALAANAAQAGVSIEEVIINGSNAGAVAVDAYHRRYPLYSGYQTGSQSGAPLAPLLGDVTAFDGGATDLQLGILNNFLIYADHVVGYRFVPRDVQQTDIQVIWYVREDAEAGRDYDADALTWLWHVTSLDDERIIRVNQEGVNSHHFVPGPLSEMEWGIRAFYTGYLDVMRQSLTP